MQGLSRIIYRVHRPGSRSLFILPKLGKACISYLEALILDKFLFSWKKMSSSKDFRIKITSLKTIDDRLCKGRDRKTFS